MPARSCHAVEHLDPSAGHTTRHGGASSWEGPVADPSGISLTFGEAKRSRGGYLVCLVRAQSGESILFADTVRLDVAESRRAFAEEVVQVAEGMTISSVEVERELLAGLE